VDLEQAAPETLTKVEELEREIDEARQELSSAEERLRQARERVDADGEALFEALGSFQQSVAERQTLLSQTATQSSEALSQLTEKISTVHADAATELAEAATAVSELEERVHAIEPEVEARFAQATAAAEALQDIVDDASTQVEQALGMAGGLLQVAAGDLEGMQGLVGRRVDALGEFVDQAWSPIVDDMGKGWSVSLEAAVAGAVATGVETAQTNLPQVLADALEQARTQHEQTLTELGGLADRLVGVLGTLTQAVDEGTSLIVEKGGTGAQSLREIAEGVQRLEAGLQRVRELLAGYTFVQL
jgi:outer membrane murein-binding lipoprotein Lpp